MANSIKLLTRSKILTEAQADDRQLCLSTVGDATAQDLTDINDKLFQHDIEYYGYFHW